MKSTKQTTISEETNSITQNFPSADLINFRFDQNDKAVAKLDHKLDTLFEQIVTPKEMAEHKTDDALIHLDIYRRLDKIEGWGSKVTWLVLSCVIITILATIGFKTLGR